MSTTTSLLGRRQPAARPRGQPAPSYARGGALKAKRSGGGVEAGPRHRPGAARTGEGWWGRGGRLASGLGSAPQTQRQGRAIRHAAHRARTRARRAAKCGQFSGASNEPLTEMEDRRATVTDALQSTTFRLYSSAAAPMGGGTETPAASYFRRNPRAGSRATSSS